MTLTTKADGTTDAKEIDAGKYYVKETKAPKGYELDEGVKTVTVDTDNDEDNPAVVNVSDIPGTDPVRFEVKKVDKDTGKSDRSRRQLLTICVLCAPHKPIRMTRICCLPPTGSSL